MRGDRTLGTLSTDVNEDRESISAPEGVVNVEALPPSFLFTDTGIVVDNGIQIKVSRGICLWSRYFLQLCEVAIPEIRKSTICSAPIFPVTPAEARAHRKGRTQEKSENNKGAPHLECSLVCFIDELNQVRLDNSISGKARAAVPFRLRQSHKQWHPNRIQTEDFDKMSTRRWRPCAVYSKLRDDRLIRVRCRIPVRSQSDLFSFWNNRAFALWPFVSM